mmetsp:Transcript_26155/g.62354  ORF Transcript_26155/g.62354 Transcript_26155/m.62354 type:complete len:97 (+) Transcript_26155:22-312(+)
MGCSSRRNTCRGRVGVVVHRPRPQSGIWKSRAVTSSWSVSAPELQRGAEVEVVEKSEAAAEIAAATAVEGGEAAIAAGQSGADAAQAKAVAGEDEW